MIKYIKSAEEFAEVLSQGKEVYSDEYKSTFKMVKGQVCVFYKDGFTEINPNLTFKSPEDKHDSLYYLEDLSFEVGKFYMCKDGYKALCAYIEKASDKEILITMVRQDNGYIYNVNTQGLTYDGFEYSERSCFSIVASWPKEEK